MPLRGRLKERFSNRQRSPKPLTRLLTSTTTLPRRGPGGIWISSKSSLRFLSASAAISSYRCSLALLLAWRALRTGADPLELVLQALALLRVLGPLDLQPGRLGLQVGGVVALVRVGVAAVELEDPLGHVVQEVPVVGDRDDGARVLLQVLLQPLHALRVQVVGGLVEQQQVGLGQQQPAQRDPALLPAGQAGDLGVGRRAAQRVHGLLDLAVQVPGVPVVQLLLQVAHLLEQFVGIVGRHLLGDLVVLLEELLGLGHAVLDVAQHRLGLVKLGLLVEQADGEARHQAGIAVGRLLHPRHHPEQGRLAGTVRAHDADLRAGQERQRDVVENDLVAVRLAHGTHLINELRHVF